MIDWGDSACVTRSNQGRMHGQLRVSTRYWKADAGSLRTSEKKVRSLSEATGQVENEWTPLLYNM